MQGEGQGAGNRRGRHGEQMGLQALVQQAIALMHPEPVLLIYHHQPKPGVRRQVKYLLSPH